MHIVHVSVLIKLKTFLEDIKLVKLAHVSAIDGSYERERQVLEISHGRFHFFTFLHNCNLKEGESIKELCTGFHWTGNPSDKTGAVLQQNRATCWKKLSHKLR